EGMDQPDGEVPRLHADPLLDVAVDHVVLPLRARASRLAAVDLRAGLALELERDVLRDVADPRSVPEPGDETPGAPQRARVVLQSGQQLQEPLVEPWERIARPVLERAEVDE